MTETCSQVCTEINNLNEVFLEWNIREKLEDLDQSANEDVRNKAFELINYYLRDSDDEIEMNYRNENEEFLLI